jgi:hypothetical protein
MNLGALYVAKPNFLRTLCQGEHRGIYRWSKAVLWPKMRHVRPSCQVSRPCNLAGRPSLVAPPPFPHWILLLPTYFDMWWKLFFGNAPGPGRPAKGVGLIGPTLGWLGPALVPRGPFILYCPWTPLVFDIIKICIDFGPHSAFLSSDVPEMVDQQNS